MRQLKQSEINKYVSQTKFSNDDLPMYAFETNNEIHIITEKAKVFMFDKNELYLIGQNDLQRDQLINTYNLEKEDIDFMFE